MPVLKGLLQNDGALVEILLGWSAARAKVLRAALRPVPPPLQVRALLDTGAEVTCVDAALIQQLGLPFGGTVPVNLPAHGGLTFGALHHASVTILHPSGNAQDHLAVISISVLELALSSLVFRRCLAATCWRAAVFSTMGPETPSA